MITLRSIYPSSLVVGLFSEIGKVKGKTYDNPAKHLSFVVGLFGERGTVRKVVVVSVNIEVLNTKT
jgi:hypothetical protein